jgi:hypothetical protein
MSEAIRQTESKDPYRAATDGGIAASFRIVIRFFDEYAAEQRPITSHEDVRWKSPTRKCRVTSDGPEATARFL